MELLDTLNQDENWRKLFGKVSSRMRDRELILRFLGLYFHGSDYMKPMKEFLNRITQKYRFVDDATAAKFSEIFKNTVAAIENALGSGAFRTTKAVNAALFDSVMNGVARRLAKGSITNPEFLKEKYETLLSNGRFKQAISAGTTDDANVADRLKISTEAFRDVP